MKLLIEQNLDREVIRKSLGYDEGCKIPNCTEDIYFTTFYYLTNRFGYCKEFDSSKEVGRWLFKVDKYEIMIYLNSGWVEFFMYGGKDIDCLKYYKKLEENLFILFQKENNLNIPYNDLDKDLKMKYYDFYSDNIQKISINSEDFEQIIGEYYQTSEIGHALTILSSFLYNMLTPIFIRDCAFNIKGVIDDDDLENYEDYKNNIDIEYVV